VTRQFAWLTVCLVGGTGLAMLVVSLAFIPVVAWERFVPVATAVTLLSVLVAGLAIEAVGERLIRPARRLLRAIEQDETDNQTVHSLLREAPPEFGPLLYGLHVTQTRLRTALRQREQERGEVGAIFEHMADSVLLLDRQERVVLSNPAAARMLWFPNPLGRSLPEVTRDAELVELARSVTGDGPRARLVELRSADPTAERRQVQAVATLLPEGRRLLVLQDISELRRAELARRDFVANVSHELRTPVAALKALVETLAAGALEDPLEGPHFLQRMHVEVDRLAQLVAELLDLARAEAGRLDLRLEICRADDLVREAAERIRPTAAQADLDVEVVLDEVQANGLWVCADPHRISQVLTNLLGNASKFTPPHGRIETGARRTAEGVELWVSDTGVGIEPEHVGRVFERFYKIDRARAFGTGTGLGLAIAKHLVLAHGGNIRAESDGPGHGSTFRVILPAYSQPAFKRASCAPAAEA
jgi:two-component system phosphate regulon sensor histidine kinase PhoR